ncbi:geranyl diphosphate synthase [Micractinium conductrix]|uniref:Geranyl diphosphate synthase n=1 Tax=Micractinium conductrix TaxID=554055 RepID=A0A2P6VCQ1_9CHLO|nr:geranyl diphosphate synthase [Micractinium conductrix]|eukprot:PSC71876.1 geranyl diphosphate synthase [Micractinium conductrix]
MRRASTQLGRVLRLAGCAPLEGQIAGSLTGHAALREVVPWCAAVANAALLLPRSSSRSFVSGSGERLGPAAAAPAAAPAAAAAEPQPAAAAAAGPSAAAAERPDAFGLVREEIECVTERLRRDIFTEIPALERAAEYFFRAGAEGKRLRSTMLLLMASALAPAPPGLDALTVDSAPPAEHPPTVRRRQQRIAEITELIHVASLLHDDVIDSAGTRRGKRSLNAVFGNKVAILAGDFLLARASVSLASLQNSEAIMLMSQSLEHLVAGEILQLTADAEEACSMDHYLRKTYCKTASLMANSCKSMAVLGGHSPADCQLAHEYGRHVGLAFQLVDDIMDFTSSASEMGKPALNDLSSGLATAPVLYAAEEQPELLPLIQRRFKEEGDVEAATAAVERSSGLQRTRQLAAFHAGEAAAALAAMAPPATEHAAEHRRGLLEITQRVLNRKK